LEGYQFHPEVATELARTVGRSLNDKATNEALRMYDSALGFWKKWVLVAPAYIVRNFFGNIWNNSYANISAKAYKEAFEVLAGRDISIAGIKFTRKDIEELAREWNAWTGGQYGEEMAKLLTPKEVERGPIGKAMDFLPELTFRLNRTVETHARLAHFISKLQEGLTPAEASLSVVKHLFDYSAATPFEEKIATRVVMFWRWYRNNMALQVGTLMHEPWRVMLPLRATQELSKSIEGPEDLSLIQPPFTKRMLGAYIGRDSKTGDIRILTQFGLPMEDLLRFDKDDLAGQISPLLKIPAELATGVRLGWQGQKIEEYQRAYGFLRALPESVKDAIGFHEVTFPNGNRAFKMNPWALYALMNTPFSRIYTQVGKATEPGGSLSDKALSSFTGVKVTRFAEEPARMKALNRSVMAELQKAAAGGRVGAFQKYFARKGTEATPEEAKLLEAQEQIRRYAKGRKKAAEK
jgi:hypothetical protein